MKVFWSWQSDRPSKVCRHFVQGALKDALNLLSDELDLEESNRPELDHDTKGVAGMAPIADTILKKIADSGAFVGDVTSIYKTRQGREVANPNVLIELGWAWAKIGEDNIVLVANRAFGPKKAEQLPFDIRHRRAVIFYDLPEAASAPEIKLARTALAKSLKEALQKSLSGWLKGAADQTGPIGRPTREGDPSVWFDKDEVIQHQPFHGGGGWQTIAVKEEPRIYVRIIPEKFTRPLPSALSIHSGEIAGTHKTLQTLGPISSGDGGLNKYGAMRYAVPHDGKGTWTIAQWFSENGEIWSFDSFRLREQTFFISTFLQETLAFIQRGVRLLEALGANGLIRIEVGAVQLSGTQWSGKFQHEKGNALQDRVVVSEARRRWTDEVQIEFMARLATQFASNYGKPPVAPDQLNSLLRM